MIKITLTPDDVKAEAERRILAVASLARQSNDNARANELLEVGVEKLTSEQMAEYRALRRRRRLIDHIRATSNRLEQDPIPLDYTADKHWTPGHD